MKRENSGTCAAVFLLAVAAVIVAGCQPPATPNEKRARLLAAQNADLEHELQARRAELTALRQKHAEELRRRDEELAQYKLRIEALQKDRRENVAERVQSVTAAVMAENAKLRQEIAGLKAQIEKLKAAAPPPERP